MLTIKGFSLGTMPNQLSLQCSSGMEWEYIGITGGVPPPNMQPGARFRAFGHSQKEAELENEHEYPRRGLGGEAWEVRVLRIITRSCSCNHFSFWSVHVVLPRHGHSTESTLRFAKMSHRTLVTEPIILLGLATTVAEKLEVATFQGYAW